MIIPKPKTLLIVFLLFGFPFIPQNRKNNVPVENNIVNNSSIFQSGDIIFRRGKSLLSRMILLADKQRDFSHVGVIIKQNDSFFVIHAHPSDIRFSDDVVKKEPLSDFCDYKDNEAISIYRVETNNSLSPTIYYLNNILLNQISFDNDFNLESDSLLYCSELVWKAYKESGIDLINNCFDEISYVIDSKKCILPGTLAQSKFLKLIYHHLAVEFNK